MRIAVLPYPLEVNVCVVSSKCMLRVPSCALCMHVCACVCVRACAIKTYMRDDGADGYGGRTSRYSCAVMLRDLAPGCFEVCSMPPGENPRIKSPTTLPAHTSGGHHAFHSFKT